MQSYTSLPGCSIASNAKMQAADHEWAPEDNRGASRSLNEFQNSSWLYSATMSNCEQLHHGYRKYVYLTRFRVARRPFSVPSAARQGVIRGVGGRLALSGEDIF